MLRGTWNSGLLTALAPVLPLLEDDRITEIEANGFDDVWVKSTVWPGHRRMRRSQYCWRDGEDFLIACIRISEVIGRQVNERRPLLNARLPGGERVNIVIPPACERIALTIRKFPAEAMTFDVLEEKRSVDASVRLICESLVLARKSILVAGGTGAGKTSLLNALSRVIPERERVVTIEDALELRIQQENRVALETVEPYEEGAVPVTIGDLVRNSLRQTPDRIVVGEVRGEEAFYLLRAFSTGHGGGFGTVHANDAVDALHQLQLLAQMAPVAGLTSQVVAAMVARAVDCVIFQGYFEDENVRRVAEVIEIERPGVRFHEGSIEYQVRRLVEWDGVEGTWKYVQPPSARLQASLARKGLPWPAASLTAPEGGAE
jgi:pilus assembly protein CpaF